MGSNENTQSACPHCGYCPACGRSNVPPGQWYVPYPYLQPLPWWQQYPYVTYGSGQNINTVDSTAALSQN